MSGKGECYQSAGSTVLRGFPGSGDDLVLVHATVMGQGGKAKGIRYGHAWVELGDAVLDTETGKAVRKETYYKLGQVEDVVRYSRDQLREMVLRFEHWGPWEEASGEA